MIKVSDINLKTLFKFLTENEINTINNLNSLTEKDLYNLTVKYSKKYGQIFKKNKDRK